MARVEYRGFGGILLAGESYGTDDDPEVLLIHDGTGAREGWRAAAIALAEAGRHVICLDLRGQGDSEAPADGRYDLDAQMGDLRAVLAGLGSRPVIVAAAAGGAIAAAVLGESASDQLATGLVLVDAPVSEPRLTEAAKRINVPTLIVRGELGPVAGEAPAELAQGMKDVEVIEVRDGAAFGAVQQADAFNALLLDFLERRVPRVPPEYQAGSDSRTLRDALGCFATGVTVVTTLAPDGTPVGLTANSFTSVSLDPPLLLVCLHNNAASLPAFLAADHFAVNVLHIGQQPVSGRFATRGEDRFAATPCEEWESRVPIIRHSLASFECARHAVHEGGDHQILVGRVLRVRFEPRRDPLLYFRGRYRRLHFS